MFLCSYRKSIIADNEISGESSSGIRTPTESKAQTGGQIDDDDEVVPVPEKSGAGGTSTIQYDLETQCKLKQTDALLLRITKQIKRVLRYLVKALLEPKGEGFFPHLETRMMPERQLAGESNYYYLMMTIWYAIKNLPDEEWEWKERTRLWGVGHHCNLFESNRLPSDNWTFEPQDREKIPLLQWLHYGSILKLCQRGFLPECWLMNGDLETKVMRLAKSSKVMSAAKLASRRHYVANDEIFYRLAFVSDELGLEVLAPYAVGDVAELSMQRIERRPFSRRLNPGWISEKVNKGWVGEHEDNSTSGPWEIQALCHHSRLWRLLLEAQQLQDWNTKKHNKEEAEEYKARIRRFLNSEGTLNPSWERAYPQARQSWLRSEATAVVATTIVTVMTHTAPTAAQDAGPHDKLEVMEEVLSVQEHALDEQKKLLTEALYIGGIMKDQLKVLDKMNAESRKVPPIDWIHFQPPRRYHPDSFCNSLEDTPGQFEAAELGKRILPISLTSHIRMPHEISHANVDLKKQDIIEVAATKCIAVIDLKAPAPNRRLHSPETMLRLEKHRYIEGDGGDGPLVWALYDNVSQQMPQHLSHI
jgi:hypothetical protein